VSCLKIISRRWPYKPPVRVVWVDFVAYDPRMPEPQRLFVRRYTPTSEEISGGRKRQLSFWQEVEAMFDQLSKVEML
jgi:hypothetical protein